MQRLIFALFLVVFGNSAFAAQTSQYYSAPYNQVGYVATSCSAATQLAISAAQGDGWNVYGVEYNAGSFCAHVALQHSVYGNWGEIRVSGPLTHDCGPGMHSVLNPGPNGLSCSATDPTPPPPPAEAGTLCEDQSGATDDNPKIYNSSGQCVSFKGSDQSTACAYLGNASENTYLNIQLEFDRDIGADILPSTAGDKSGCQVEVLQPIKCVTPPPNCRDGICILKQSICTVEAKFTGQPAATSEDPTKVVCLDGSCASVPTDKVVENQPCDYTTNAAGERVCKSVNSSGTPTVEQGGQVTPGQTVVNEVNTVENTTVNSDGSSTTVKTDTLTKYECTGNTCTHSTSTSTTTTNKAPTGSTTGSNTTCTGPYCNSNGTVNSGTGGTGGTGTEPGEACGGSGNPCAIDDSGFRNLPTDLGGAGDKLGQDEAQWLDLVNSVSGSDMHGVDLEFMPTLPKASCAPIEYGLPGKMLSIEWCEKAEIIKTVGAWLLYIFTGWFIFESFFGRTDKSSK